MYNIIMSLFVRTKDNTFVFCALKEVITKALAKATEMGIDIHQIVHKV